jgi:hypothetical protein
VKGAYRELRISSNSFRIRSRGMTELDGGLSEVDRVRLHRAIRMMNEFETSTNDRSKRSRTLRILIGLAVVGLTGCFGPTFMNMDMGNYNQQIIAGEEEMILFNIERLRNHEPPHFMTLSEVDPTRSFSTNASFQWTQLWNDLLIPFVSLGAINNGSVASKGSSAYQAGLSAGIVENPTYRFLPLQGPEFAQRFESPLTDKLSLFLEDQQYYDTNEERAMIANLFVESLKILHGNNGPCWKGVFVNRLGKRNDDTETYFSTDFDACLNQIMTSYWNSEVLDANREIPTEAPEDPQAVDLVNPVRMLGLFDYDPAFSPPASHTNFVRQSPMFWVESEAPSAKDLNKLPPGYKWKINEDHSRKKYALMPQGYGLSPNGESIEPLHRKSIKTQPSYVDKILAWVSPYQANYVYVEIRNPLPTATPTAGAFASPTPAPSLLSFGKASPTVAINRADLPETVVGQRPVRRTGQTGTSTTPSQQLTDGNVEQLCYPEEQNGLPADNADVVCGYAKVGNLLEIMQRLGDQACGPQDLESKCKRSIFGVGPKAPEWAFMSARDAYQTSEAVEQSGVIWVPAHNPNSSKDEERKLGERDMEEFTLLYKLYQMSLVDTSKLATSSIPITISK